MKPQKPIIINAFHGLGDIIFSIPIYRKLIAEGHTVIHPYLNDSYGPIWKHWPEVTWMPKNTLAINYNDKSVVENDFFKILPLRWQEKAGAVMRSKYDYMGVDFMDWRKVTWKRDLEAEQFIFDSLGLKEGEPYCLVNTMFQHDDKGRIKINPPQGMKTITLRKIKGYTLLDWGKVLENATEIHTVGTSINYILDPDFLDIKAPIHLYIRRPNEKNFDTYSYLLKKDYIWHHE